MQHVDLPYVQYIVMSLTVKSWIISALTASERCNLPSKPRARVIHIYPNSEGGGNSTLNLSSSVSQPLLGLFSDGKHTVKGVLTENALQTLGTRLDVDKESLVGGNVVLLRYQVHANLTVENELERELILIIDKFKYLGGEGGRVDNRRLVDSRTVEEVKVRLLKLAGESDSSLLGTPGEMTQLVCCLDHSHKSEEEDDLEGRFANIETLRRIASQVVEINNGDEVDDVMVDNRKDRDVGDVSSEECRIPGKAPIISADQQQKIDHLIRQITENTNKEMSDGFLTSDGDDESVNELDPPLHVLPSELVDNFSANQEPLEIVIPVGVELELEVSCQSASPGNEPITIDIEDQVTREESRHSSKETDKVRGQPDNNKTDATIADQLSDATTFSGSSSGQTTENQPAHSKRIRTNMSVLGFSISALPSSVVSSSNGFPGNQEQAISGDTVPSIKEKEESEKQEESVENLADNEEKEESEKQEESVENLADNERQEDGSTVDQDQSERLMDMVDSSPDQPAKQASRRNRKRRLSDDESDELSSVYPKRFLSLRLNPVEMKDHLLSGLTSHAATDDDVKSELYQFCLQYWKEKKDLSMFGGLFHSEEAHSR